MTSTIFDKTEKGREEIATRKYHLASRLRTLLVLIDGKHSADDLLKKVAGIGLNEESLSELLANGFIQAGPAAAVPASAPAQSPNPPAPIPDATTVAGAPESILPQGESQFEAIYHFYTETIKSTIGLRGYGLQLKVEKAGSIEEFRQLRTPYLEAVLKAKGNEMARSLRDRLDQLLYLGEAIAPPSTIMPSDTSISD